MNRTIREMTLRMKQNGNGRRRLFHWLSGPMTKGAPVRWNTRKRGGSHVKRDGACNCDSTDSGSCYTLWSVSRSFIGNRPRLGPGESRDRTFG